MKITNVFELPQALVDACDVSPHNAPNTVSATTLKSGVREILLTKRHWEEMEDDVSNRIWTLFGTAVHALLERESPDTFVEEKFEKKVGNKYTLTGRLDCYDMKNKIIFDYKTATVWKYKFKDFEDWKFQGLVYAWLLKQQGLEVKECRFVAMFKDFSKSKAKFEPDYPESPIYVYKFDVTEEDLEEIEKIIKKKIELLEDSELDDDESLPLCTPEERWRKDEYAVMKNGRKSALKLFKKEEYGEKAEEMANKYAEEVGGFVVDRSNDAKCNGYCQCCKFCSYWKINYEQE